MNRLCVAALLATAALFAMNSESQAHGCKYRNDCCTTACAPAACEPAPVKYEDRKCIQYKRVIKEKEIEVLQCKRVTSEEKYTYTVCVPVMKEEMRKVIVCTPVTKEVECTYTVMVPEMTQKTIQCTTYQCVRENIVETVPVCRTVCTTVVDECGHCRKCYQRVTVMEERTRCVVKRIPIVTEKVVNVCTYRPETRTGKRTVCEIVRSEKEVAVKVCSYVTEKRDGTRLVCSTVTEKVKKTVSYCEMVAEEVTVRVAVCTPSCSTDCCTTRCCRRGDSQRGTAERFYVVRETAKRASNTLVCDDWSQGSSDLITTLRNSTPLL